VQIITENTEFFFRAGLVMFIFGVLLIIVDKDFNKKIASNSFVAKVFTMRVSTKFSISTDPYGSVIAFFGITIAILALVFAPV